MLLFSERKALNNIYNKWLKDNPIVIDNFFNFINFLSINNLLDDRKVTDFIKEEIKKEILE